MLVAEALSIVDALFITPLTASLVSTNCLACSKEIPSLCAMNAADASLKAGMLPSLNVRVPSSDTSNSVLNISGLE